MIVGIDEVGRGPLVGNVVACAVILDPLSPIEGLTDSKKISEKKRLLLDQEIKAKAIDYAFGECTPAEIDDLNILNASLKAMQRAFFNLKLSQAIEKVLVDGNRSPDLPVNCEAIVKGDLLIPSISAASILAKVYRDAQMQILHNKFPVYGFDKHKGYPTKLHLERLKLYGVLAVHRQSFRPVRQLRQSAG